MGEDMPTKKKTKKTLIMNIAGQKTQKNVLIAVLSAFNLTHMCHFFNGGRKTPDSFSKIYLFIYLEREKKKIDIVPKNCQLQSQLLYHCLWNDDEKLPIGGQKTFPNQSLQASRTSHTLLISFSDWVYIKVDTNQQI